MFTWINKQGVRSAAGFEVQSTGRFTIEYREGARRLVVDVEPSGNDAIGFDPACFNRWLNSAERISDSTKEQMIQNFLDALQFQGLRGIR
ncbi:hypothetical protein [Roseateles paludis]|uniref:Uncharacterized protein n=1 Tax=Roseateles paludis TaxID=3145238 RepID=A0ABV0FVA7_9BURK